MKLLSQSNNRNKQHSRSSSIRSQHSIHLTNKSLSSISNGTSPNTSALSIHTLSTSSPLNFVKSPSNNILNDLKYCLSNDSQRLDLIKKLDQYLTKFLNIKKNSVLKTNILRLNLLKYLRFPIKPFINMNELLSTSIIDLNIDLLLLEANTLLNWWSELLNILLNDYQSITTSDRNCYFESVSRLVSQNIWLLFQLNIDFSLKFNEIYETFKKLLLKTFEFSIIRLNSKAFSLSISIFIGKIFSFSFFHLGDISKGLSFLLNTKLIHFKKIYNICIYDSFNSLNLNQNSNSTNQFANILNDLASQYPNHLIPLISSNIHTRNVNYIIESQFINSIYPPREKIEGIKETKGIWVNRWSSTENISLFCSFFRNYLTLSSTYLRNLPLIMINKFYIYGIPGFLYFLTHIYQIFDLQIKTTIKNNNLSSNSKFRINNTNNINNNINNNNNNISYDDNNLLLSIPPKFSNESNIDKCFDILRDFLINPRNSNENLLKPGLIKGYENILKLFVIKTNILDTFMIETILNLFIQFLKIIDVSDENNSSDSSFSIIDWHFWIDILIRLLESNNLSCEIKSFSTFYQIWDFIPTNFYLPDENVLNKYSWIKNSNYSIKLNTVIYLLNEKNWLKFFGHYMQIERILYIKLLIWKIMGISSFDNLIKFQNFEFKNSIENLKIKELIKLRLFETHEKTKGLIFKSTNPLLFKKFIINESNGVDEKKRDKKLRIYPYEVLDDSVYSTSKQIPKSKNVSNPTSSNILINADDDDKSSHKLKTNNWMGKIFNKPTSETEKSSKGFGKFLHLKYSSSSSSTSSSSSLDKKENNSPISSLSSSLSSLELNANNSKNRNNINESKNDTFTNNTNNEEFLNPPEWNHKIDIKKERYEFTLVNNDLKLQSFLKILHSLNNGDLKFTANNNDILLINDEPRLPSIKIEKIIDHNNNSFLRLNMDSLESIVNDFDNDDGSFLGNTEIDDNMIDLNGGFDNIPGIDLNVKQNDNFVTATKIIFDNNDLKIKNLLKNTSSSITYLCNGLLEYNEEILIFENFISDRLCKLEFGELTVVDDFLTGNLNDEWNTKTAFSTDDDNDDDGPSYLEIPTYRNNYDNIKKTYSLSNKGYKKLKLDIPSIISELPGDKLNGY